MPKPSNIEIWGNGPVHAIFLHGWMADSSIFAPMLPALDRDRFTIAFVDYRGCGRLKESDGPFTVEAIAKDVIAAADALGWDRFHLVGHSMGGKVALHVAASHPSRVDRLVGVTPVWAGAVQFDEPTIAFFRSAGRDIAAREAIFRNTTGGRLPSAWSSQLAIKSSNITSDKAVADYFESWAFDDFSQRIQGLANRTLVILGAHDAGISEAAIRETWMKELPNTSLKILPESGHYPMIENPPLLAALIESFLV